MKKEQLDLENIVKNNFGDMGMFYSSKLDTDTYLIGLGKSDYIIIEFDLREGTEEELRNIILKKYNHFIKHERVGGSRFTGKEIKEVIKRFNGTTPDGIVFENSNLNRFVVRDNKIIKTYSYTNHSLTRIHSNQLYELYYFGEVCNFRIKRTELSHFLSEIENGFNEEDWIPS